MKITEKLYIERLEKMLKKYKGDPCPHCPMAKNYIATGYILEDNGKYDGNGWDLKACNICRKLTQKYVGVSVKDDESIELGWCPCNYFEDYFNGRFGTIKHKMPEGYMAKVAWKVIRGWKKDNKQEV